MAGKTTMPQLSRVVCSILDYRSPEQYIFVPDWMMKSLRLRPWDTVYLRYKVLPSITFILCHAIIVLYLSLSLSSYIKNHESLDVVPWCYIPMSMPTNMLFRFFYAILSYLKQLPQGTGCVHLQAHTSDLARLPNSDKVLEEELRHYSSLTAGTTIKFVFRTGKKRGAGRTICINVLECLDGSDSPVDSVCIQDADVRTEVCACIG